MGVGAVGNAEWTGIWLGELLREAGIHRCSGEVILEGAEAGRLPNRRGPMAKFISPAACR